MNHDCNVQEVLDQIVTKHADLLTLRNALPKRLDLTPQWLEQACAHPRYAVRGLILRALLGDYRLGGQTEAVLDQGTVNRMAQYVVHHPAKGLTHLAQGQSPIAQTLPKHFETLFGLNRKDFVQGCADLVVHTLLGHRYGNLPGLPEGIDLTPLQPIMAALYLSPEVMDTWLSAIRGQDQRWARFGAYFETGYDEIDLYNLVLFIDPPIGSARYKIGFRPVWYAVLDIKNALYRPCSPQLICSRSYATASLTPVPPAGTR